MKRSTQIVLLISGAILNGCSDKPAEPGASGDWSQPMTNNTYVGGRGYYHAPYRGFYVYPHNHYIPGKGYYYGGTFHSTADRSSVTSSTPAHRTSSSQADRGGFTRSRSSGFHFGGS